MAISTQIGTVMGELRAVARDPRFHGHVILLTTLSLTCSAAATEFSPVGRLALAVICSLLFAMLLLFTDAVTFKRTPVSRLEATRVRMMSISASAIWTIAFAYFNVYRH